MKSDKRIMIVDDMHTVLATMSNILSIHYECITITDPKKALELCNQISFDCIITDLNLDLSINVTSGIDFIDDLHSIGYQGKIIAMTGYATKKIEARVKDKVDLFIEKPFKLMDIILWLKQNI